MPSPYERPVAIGAGRSGRPVGYVVKAFPRLSETFVLNEILAREAAGEHVEIASLRSPTDARFHRGLADLRAPVTWIADHVRSSERVWSALADGRRDLPFLDRALPDLLDRPVEEAVQAIEVARWALDRGVDHLHAHFATTATTVARLASRMTGLPYSFTAHAKDIFHESVDDAALRRALRDAHHVVTVSDHNLHHLRRRFPGVTSRLHRVHNGVDTEGLGVAGPSGPSGPASPDPGAGAVVSVGRLVAKKGFGHLVEAARHLAARGVDVPFLIGGAGVEEGDLRRRIDGAGLDGRVRLLGPLTQDRAHDLIRGGRVFAAPFVVAPDGDREGLPTVVLEAMAIGTPVVATPVAGVPEAVVDGVTGLLVPEGDPVALADAIDAILADPELGGRLAAAARTLVERRFSLPRQAAELARLRRDGARCPHRAEPAVAAS